MTAANIWTGESLYEKNEIIREETLLYRSTSSFGMFPYL